MYSVKTGFKFLKEEEEEEEILGSDDDEQEAPQDYCKGGYHAVKIGDLYHNRYHVIRYYLCLFTFVFSYIKMY